LFSKRHHSIITIIKVKKIEKATNLSEFQNETTVAGSESGLSLIPTWPKAQFEQSLNPVPESIISWSPPIPNWNTWSACNIDEGPMAKMSSECVSEQLQKEFQDMQKIDTHYQQMRGHREQLPVFGCREQIMTAISEHPVIIVRGSTGCGKTTQVNIVTMFACKTCYCFLVKKKCEKCSFDITLERIILPVLLT
jgi:HrpA-like RNA helicase